MKRNKSDSELYKSKWEPPKNPFIKDYTEQIEARREYDRKRKRDWSKRKVRADRYRAREMVKAAIKRGDLRRGDCELRFYGCMVRPTEAHHKSYEPGYELDIVWACKHCHDKITYRKKNE